LPSFPPADADAQKPRPTGPKPGSIGAIIGQFKSAATKRLNGMRSTPGATVWHRNYYEHIIRNDADLNRIRRYIADNPLRWALDAENPKQEK
jgi:REP element-mobilizing transposase RayT